jgi:ATP-dependent DNA helicase Rep
LKAANNVIELNPKIYPKTLFSELGEGEPVRVVQADHEEHEAERVVARIQSLRSGSLISEGSQGAIQWRDISLLYRANHQSRILEQALAKAQIPYKVSGGQSFFDRAEIKDLCAWLRLMVNNEDDPAFLRAITTPKRGIGHQTLSSLGAFASQYKLSLFESLFSHSLHSAVSSKAIAGLHEFGRLINDLEYKAKHIEGHEGAEQFFKDWLAEIEYEKYLFDQGDNDKASTARWTYVLEFCDWMAKRCGGIADTSTVPAIESERKNLFEVIQTISILSTLSEREKDSNVVTLSTLHAAKGLEWPHVFLVGVCEGMLPFQNESDQELDEAIKATRIEEERRLMYVGITRAQRSLTVSWCKRRKKGREMINASPSRFIAEMKLTSDAPKEDPLAKLRALRAEFAQKVAQDKDRDVVNNP